MSPIATKNFKMDFEIDGLEIIESRPSPAASASGQGTNETNQIHTTPTKRRRGRPRNVSMPKSKTSGPDLPPTPADTPESISVSSAFSKSSSSSRLNTVDNGDGSPRPRYPTRARQQRLGQTVDESCDIAPAEPPETSPLIGPETLPEVHEATPEQLTVNKSRADVKGVARRARASEPILPHEQIERPATKPRSASDSVVTESRYPHQIDATLATKIQKGPHKYVSSGELQSLYIFPTIMTNRKTGERVKVVKIGRTKNEDVLIRGTQLDRSCKDIKRLKQREDSHLPRVLYSDYIEKMAHAELFNFRYLHECSCETQHTEYFRVDEGTAYDVVRRWIKFCDHEPWHPASKKLLPEWARRLENRPKSARGEDIGDHKARIKRWDRFVHASPWNWLVENDLPLLGEFLWYWKWQGLASLQSILFMLWAAYWWVVISLCLVIVMIICEERPQPQPSFQYLIRSLLRTAGQIYYRWEKDVDAPMPWPAVDVETPFDKRNIPGTFCDDDEVGDACDDERDEDSDEMDVDEHMDTSTMDEDD